jgi:integrase
VFPEGIDNRLRTAIGRACKATGTPLFSPHDLRHRRATLSHLQGVPPAEAASWLGHSPREHVRTYAHVVIDRRDLDYQAALERDGAVHTPVPPALRK